MPYVRSGFQFMARTTITNGVGSRVLLPETIRGLGGKRAFLVTDPGLVRAGLLDKILELFDLVPTPVTIAGVFDRVEQDAKAHIINEAARAYRECAADSLIALGGGSVLDTVKGIKWMVSRGLTDIRPSLIGNVLEMWPDAQPIFIPHVALPTTAGTGAEASPIAVVFHDDLGVKVNLINPFINADIAILDPELTVGLPPSITAFTGFDALTHAIEGFFSPQANPFTDAYAIQSARMIFENLPKAVANGQDLTARANMLMASTMAIISFSLALNAIPVHNMAHAFGAKFGIPHGLANAVLLPNVMAAMSAFYRPRVREFMAAVGFDAPADPDAALEALIQRIRDLREQVGLPATFADYQLDKRQLGKMVDLVHADPSGVVYRLPDAIIQRVTREVAS